MKIQQLKATTLSNRAYEAIKDLIIKNELLPGSLVSINSIANSLSISPTPVREAFARLSFESFLVGEPHKRVRVSSITEYDVQQIYGVRKLIEPQAAAITALGIAKDSVLMNSLVDIQEGAQTICSTPADQINKDDYLDIDYKLHEIFLTAVDSFFREVLEFVGIRSLRIRTFAETTSRSQTDGLIVTVTKEHLQIIEAILEGNAEKAKSAVSMHLENGEARTLQAVKALLRA